MCYLWNGDRVPAGLAVRTTYGCCSYKITCSQRLILIWQDHWFSHWFSPNMTSSPHYTALDTLFVRLSILLPEKSLLIWVRETFFFMHLPIVCFLWSILMLQTNVKRFSSLLPLFQLLPTVNLKIISSQKYNSRADGYFNTNCIYKCHVVKERNIALTFYLPNCYQPALYVNWTLNSMVAVLLLCFNVIWVKAHKYNQEFVLKIYKCKKILLHLSTSDYVLVEEKPPI